MGKGTFKLTAAGIATSALMLLPASAPGATVTLGQIAPMGSTDSCGACTDFQLQTDSGAPPYVVPGGGPWTITSWSTRGGTISSQMQLRIFRATGTPDQYRLVAESLMETVPANSAPSFATSIPVQAGDLLGLQTGPGNSAAGSADPYYPGTSPSDVVGLVFGSPAVGDTVGGGGGDPAVGPNANSLLNVSAGLTTPDRVPQPSNTFTFGRLQRNAKKGIAFLFIKNLPGPGLVGLSGPGVQRIDLASPAAGKSLAVSGGTVKLRVAPAKKGKKARRLRKRLRNKGEATVEVSATYVPTGGHSQHSGQEGQAAQEVSRSRTRIGQIHRREPCPNGD